MYNRLALYTGQRGSKDDGKWITINASESIFSNVTSFVRSKIPTDATSFSYLPAISGYFPNVQAIRTYLT